MHTLYNMQGVKKTSHLNMFTAVYLKMTALTSNPD